MKAISVVIITFNEEQNIARCLNSVQTLADEIVVVDSFSTDKTEEICKGYNTRFIKHRFEGHIQQKNFAMEQATNDLVLSLDADEELSEELKKNIAEIKTGPKADGYTFNRLNYYCGKFIRHGVWYPDRKLRLWDRTKGRWGGENPHDKVLMNENTKVDHIRGDLHHYSYSSIAAHIQQMNKFSDIAAMEALKRGKRTHVFIHLVLHPIGTFLKSYVLRLGFLDGTAGYMVAASAGYYRYLKYSKLLMLAKSAKKAS